MPKKFHTRRRALPRSYTGNGIFYQRTSKSKEWTKSPVPFQSSACNFDGFQETGSEGQQWPAPKRAPLTDRGGPFRTVKCVVGFVPSTNVTVVSEDELRKYEGPLLPQGVVGPDGVFVFDTSPWSSDDDLDELGAEAIARCAPTNPVSNLGTALGEIVKDGLPALPGKHLWESRTKALLGVSGEFLNAVFGWLPMTEDIGESVDAARHARDILDQYVRDNGKVVRRQYSFPNERTESVDIVATNARAQLGGGQISVGKLNTGTVGRVERNRVITRKRSFSGAFTYHIPPDDDFVGAVMGAGAQADKLFGMNLTPSLLWELTPWSWAIDWFSNTQEVITNLERIKIYGLVLRYGYVMEHTIITDTYRMIDGSGRPGTKVTAVSPITIISESKVRRPANPFGFGVSWDGLSPLQLAIAGALGITRVLR